MSNIINTIEKVPDITAIVLTYNEENNLEECLKSICKIVKRIVVVDSYSTDKTKDIALKYGASFYEHKWENYAKQFQFALDNTDIDTIWILKIDADERLTDDSAKEICMFCDNNEQTDINGLVLRFKYYFLGKYLKHGAYYPIKKMGVFKNGIAHIEQRNMDEHVVLEQGKSICAKKDCLHHDCKSITDWVQKHNKYASREADDYFQKSTVNSDMNQLDKHAKRKRKIKYNFYYKMPSGFRSRLYFFYRYIIRGGFLDGKPGKYFAFLHAYWYRYLVDIKIYEKKINE